MEREHEAELALSRRWRPCRQQRWRFGEQERSNGWDG